MSKVNRMERRVSHSEILMSNRKLDDYYFHKNLMLSADLPFPNLVDEIDRINSVNAYKSLRGDANRSDVCTNPFDISVHYDFNINRIVIPSAALHPPFFGLNYPRAYNYGAIGYIIAREMLRGFDHKGKDFDAEGNYVQWLPDNKVQTINKRVSCLSELFGKADGNGKDDEKSLENIATSEGLKLAFKIMGAKIDSPDKAFATSYKKHGAEPRLSGLEEFTNHQLFFIGFASMHCEQNVADEGKQQLVPHWKRTNRTYWRHPTELQHNAMVMTIELNKEQGLMRPERDGVPFSVLWSCFRFNRRALEFSAAFTALQAACLDSSGSW
ncbi:peptidase family M13 [Ancylostoma ceylanicum]|uniref:Peptidase family M13 n=1 Tax=Ancylostoma ceylanicum TaxID=53326 RepID=A0A0D6LZ62_9BILA|nr:peptidase family M13 [Ancylostoma ceylanicum]